jgi:lipoyl-dependent peroxiredoxin
MPVRSAKVSWEGSVAKGHGTVAVESGRLDAPYSFGSRFETAAGTNPEELLGAAAASCFTMALSLALSELGHPPTRIDTSARVAIEKAEDGFRIPRIELDTEATVPGIDGETFRREAEKAKSGCPVSKALAATEIELTARLTGTD